MKQANVPVLDPRYWLALLAASVVGTTFGDFVSEDLHFTFAGALLPLALVFGLILVFERRSRISTVAWYWIAVVIFRSMATNLGDTISRTLKLGYGGVSLVVAGLLAVLVAVIALRSSSASVTRTGSGNRKLLKIDTQYWVLLLVASVFGTTFGDYLADDAGLGFGRASLLLCGILAVAAMFDARAARANDVRYWAMVALVRTAGTTLGDFLSEGKPGLGFAPAALVAAVVLVTLVAAPSVLARLQWSGSPATSMARSDEARED
jgi:uncharacterized membrane-anchored protein